MPKREYRDIECSVCHAMKPLGARGMCRACYSRWQKTGAVEYKRKFTACTVEGCGRKHHADGLCSMHWQRKRRTGEVGGAGPDRAVNVGYSSHEMYQTWDNARRRDMDPAWSDFEVFIAAIGERPSRKHRLIRRDLARPLGPNNFEWREPLISKLPGESKVDYDRRYKVEQRERHGHAHREQDLVHRYGITLSQRTTMAESQQHVCAVCGKPEIETVNGAVKALAVDHDHATGKVRGLLCTACNTGLGKFRDDPLILASAIAYLTRHKAA